MHELSIAMSIVDLAEEEAEQRNASVRAIHLKLGPLSGVVKKALLSAFELACESTDLHGVQLIVEEVPIVVYCPHCAESHTLASMQWFVCPACGQPVSDVRQGRELQVTALEIVGLEVTA
jgi:hydrogenase nickel incorporation protein HypA/HybF